MVLLTFDEDSGVPKYRQIIDQIRQKIEAGSLRLGEKLPSTRRLADKLGIHRSTVSLAYQELWALGYIDLRPGASPKVRRRMEMAGAGQDNGSGSINWRETASGENNAIWETFMTHRSGKSDDAGLINFSTLEMDRRLFPVEYFKSSLNRVIRDHGMDLLGYGDKFGYLKLREYLARHLQCHGISVTADHILITSGSQQAIDLVFRMLGPGKTVAFEAPSYNYMLPLLRFNGIKPLEIPFKADGMDLDFLEKKVTGKKEKKPSLVYTMPNLHNPTGVSTGQEHRERLLSLCEAAGVPVLEDGFEEEMKYFGRVVLPVKSMDRGHIVIYCGTFSKVLFPGLRIGWVAADTECVQRMAAIRCFSEVSPSVLLHAAIYDFCRNGYYDRHISKMHRVFRKRMQTALQSLKKHISRDLAEWTEPAGGYLIWLKLKKKTSTKDLETALASHKLKLLHGRYCFYSEEPDTYIRLSISSLNEQEIEEGVKRLKECLRRAGGTRTLLHGKAESGTDA